MPRGGPSSSKRQQGGATANHHRNTQHENGIVGPGRRVVRQKSSQPQLDGPRSAAPGHENGHSGTAGQGAAPTAARNSAGHATNGSTNGAAKAGAAHRWNGHAHHFGDSADGRYDDAAGQNGGAPSTITNGRHRGVSVGGMSVSSSSSLSSRDSADAYPAASMSNGSGAKPGHDRHDEMSGPGPRRTIDVNAARNASVHRDTGVVDTALTVLKQCPLADTLAILVLLLQMPPVILWLAQSTFALLTTTVNSASWAPWSQWSLSLRSASGLGLSDILGPDMTSGLLVLANSSIWAVLGIDLLTWMLWAGFFPGLRMSALVLDFANVVIALSLGGGSIARGGSGRVLFVCVAVVILFHFIRRGGLDPSLLKLGEKAADSFVTGSATSATTTPPAIASTAKLMPIEATVPIPSLLRARVLRTFAFVRNVVTIHVLGQGIARYCREQLARYARWVKEVKEKELRDPEAGPQPSPLIPSSVEPYVKPSASSVGGSGGGGECQQTAAVAAADKRRGSKATNAQARLRQPLWAAIASTKIIFAFERESKQSRLQDAGKRSLDLLDLGSADFREKECSVWTSYIGPDEICFTTTEFPDVADDGDEDAGGEREDVVPPGVDRSKPLYVMINNMVWSATKFERIQKDGEDCGWSISVSALAPYSLYECQFVCTRTGEVVYTTSIRTETAKKLAATAAGSADAQGAGAGARWMPPPPRPRITAQDTLLASIKKHEAELAEKKEALVAMKKENRSKIQALKKEIEKATATALSVGSGDVKLKQKIQQNNVTRNAAEAACAELDEAIAALETVPESDQKQYDEAEAAFKAEKARSDEARREFKAFKAGHEAEIKALQDEKASLEARRSRLAARISKVEADHSRLVDANERGINEAERRAREREAFERETAALEAQYQARIAQLTEEYATKERALNDIEAGVRAFGASIHHHAAARASGNQAVHHDPQHAMDHLAAATTAYPQYSWNQPASGSGSLRDSGVSAWGGTPSASSYAMPGPSSSSLSLGQMHQATASGSLIAPHPSTPSSKAARARSSSMLSNLSGISNGLDHTSEYVMAQYGAGGSGSHHQNTYHTSHHQHHASTSSSAAGMLYPHAPAPPSHVTHGHGHAPSPHTLLSRLVTTSTSTGAASSPGGITTPLGPNHSPNPFGVIGRHRQRSDGGGSGSASGASGSGSGPGSVRDPASPGPGAGPTPLSSA